MRPSIRQGYATHIRLYLIPRLGRILLHQVTSRAVTGLLATLTSRPSPTGRQLSPATVVRIHATLLTALSAAVCARANPHQPGQRRRAAASLVATSDRLGHQADGRWQAARYNLLHGHAASSCSGGTRSPGPGTDFDPSWHRSREPFDKAFLNEALRLATELQTTAPDLAVNGDLPSERVLRGTREPWVTVDPILISGHVECGLARTTYAHQLPLEPPRDTDADLAAAPILIGRRRPWSR